MEAVKKKWFWGIFISILTIFAMSHNASAIDLVIDLNQYSLVRYVNAISHNCSFTGGVNNQTDNVSRCTTTVSGAGSLQSIVTYDSYSLKNGDLISFYLIEASETTSVSHKPILNLLNGNTTRFNVLSYKEVSQEEYYKDLSSYSGYINEQGNNYDLNVDFSTYMGFYKIYNVVLRSNVNGTYPIGLTASGTRGLFTFDAQDIGQKFSFRINNIVQYEFSGSEANKEQQEKTQEAVDDSQDAGSSSSSSAQSGTTGLLNAITGAVSVISSASPTNCKINGNMGNLDMGQLDLCANPAPAFIQTIGSLILILMCVPLAISLFNRFIAIFRSFQS